jgi:hypothetical protein
MAMGKRERDRGPTMWITMTDLPTTASHPFYRRLNQLHEQRFDDFEVSTRIRCRYAISSAWAWTARRRTTRRFRARAG